MMRGAAALSTALLLLSRAVGDASSQQLEVYVSAHGDDAAEVVRHAREGVPELLLLVVGHSVVGGGATHCATPCALRSPCCPTARYTAPEYADQSPFLNFAVLSGWVHARPPPRRALLLGLGAGTVAGAMREAGVVVDVVERNDAVVRAATEHFGHVTCDGESTPCSVGRTLVCDALDALHKPEEYGLQPGATPPPSPFLVRLSADARARGGYDVVLHDLFTGFNPTELLAPARVGEMWRLTSTHGYVLVNFMGFCSAGSQGENSAAHALAADVLHTLQATFGQGGFGCSVRYLLTCSSTR